MPLLPTKILGRCPACGESTLRVFVDAAGNGDLTCVNEACTHQQALAALLVSPETHHIVEFLGKTFSLKHPLIERIDDQLFRCDLHQRLADLGGPPDWLGYSVRAGGGATWRQTVRHFRVLDHTDPDPDLWRVELIPITA